MPKELFMKKNKVPQKTSPVYPKPKKTQTILEEEPGGFEKRLIGYKPYIYKGVLTPATPQAPYTPTSPGSILPGVPTSQVVSGGGGGDIFTTAAGGTNYLPLILIAGGVLLLILLLRRKK